MPCTGVHLAVSSVGFREPRGICIQHLAFDRAVFCSLSSRLEARVAAYYDEEVGMFLEKRQNSFTKFGLVSQDWVLHAWRFECVEMEAAAMDVRWYTQMTSPLYWLH